MSFAKVSAAGVALLVAVGVASAQNLSNPGNWRSTAKDLPEDNSHSHFGSAFNTGPRRHALPNPGAGGVHFPITTASPDAQAFFDQGLNLVYSFQWLEAERAFREGLQHDPECAMLYWGLAMTDSGRGKEFVEMAREKAGAITDRERRYIDALGLLFKGKSRNEGADENRAALKALMEAYPDDLDAKAMYAWTLPKKNPETMDGLLREVLAVNPLHPGANHYRIHLWDGVPDPRRALDSAANYTIAAPNVGHAQHMPGHIYASSGLWTQAVDSMDRATRVEKKFMAQYGFLPHESWNYAHNQDYLISNLGYVGRISEGLRLARELLDVPRDPKGNTATGYGPAGNGRFDTMRMNVRGERWDSILAAASQEDSEELPRQKSWRQYAQALAEMGKGRLDAAEVLVKALEESKPSGNVNKCALLEVRGRLAVMRGRTEEGLADLREAAKIEDEKLVANDPPAYPRPLYESLAWALMQAGRWDEAESVLAKVLEEEPENGFALAQRAEVLLRLDRKEASQRVLDKLAGVWRYADADLPALRRLLAACDGSGLSMPTPVPYVADAERESYGPNAWEPPLAPAFELKHTSGVECGLEQSPGGGVVLHGQPGLPNASGRYLVLVFYLGGECEHCVEQLRTFQAEHEKLEAAGAVLWAVTPEAWDGAPQMWKDDPAYPAILSDPGGKIAALYGARDEFEDLPLHATVLVDPAGRIRWRNVGSEPFTDVKFLIGEIERLKARSGA
ncbi:MAG: redoxin domain-containing protein [Fimbriimonadaceae bacterium]|nr:redoxin domain-containing protein [Chthonomonadaceae bacterium]MCO5296914.1 redoxin domain-containing protein [Fimbriimonadaceae bacterium]